MIDRAVGLFPLWAVLAAAAGILWPAPLTSLRENIPLLLALIMLGMGMTLRADDFARVVRRSGVIALGAVLQFGLMPLLGWTLAILFDLPDELAVGVVLVGACPGGTASNLVCFLARGDVALSISLTAVSTLLAVVATPALTWLYVGQRVPVPAGDMLVDIATIVILPVVVGVAANTWWGARLRPALRIFPLLSVTAIAVIIAIVVALNRERVDASLAMLGAVVVMHNLLGLAAGYLGARFARRSEIEARTLAIEVGMQNSGLAVALATNFFGAAAALPGALFSVWHNLSGAAAATWWARIGAGRSAGA